MFCFFFFASYKQTPTVLHLHLTNEFYFYFLHAPQTHTHSHKDLLFYFTDGAVSSYIMSAIAARPFSFTVALIKVLAIKFTVARAGFFSPLG